MKKEILYILSVFLILCTVSAAFAVSGANDFTVPMGFEETNANEDLANYNHDGLAHNVHIMIQQFDSFDEAKEEMYDSIDYNGNMSIFYDEDYGDLGYEEIVQDSGKYYLISIYSMGHHTGSYTEHALDDVEDGIKDFNELNHITPLALQ
ncbi:hypothetical protein [Methanobrevibacter ruminantium]|uniref:hypothetical protein n=1 Tax=Methanobrevibacter ruminantium TaxID=83816 RepID=UPI0026EA183B|nr:hypothetical protein [Methanobrevibacter ruminantium]